MAKAPPVHGGGGHAPKVTNMTPTNFGSGGAANKSGQNVQAHPGVHPAKTKALPASFTPAQKPKAKAPANNGLGPYNKLIETPKQMNQQALTATNQIYQPIIDNLNQQSATATGLAQKRASDAQNFTAWAAGQQATMMTQAANQDQQYNSLMSQISSGMNTNEAAQTANSLQGQGIVSNMNNSTALGQIAANQGAMNNSTTGALQSAAANMANNQSNTNAWGALSTATAANMQQQDNADYNNSINTINQNLAQAQSDQANARQSMLSSLQSQNATNVKNATDYAQQQWANKNTLQQQALSQRNTNAQNKESLREFNVGVKQKAFEDQASANQWASDYKQKATEDQVAQGQKDMDSIQAAAAMNGGSMTYAQANEYNQAYAAANPGTVPMVIKPPKGKSMGDTYTVGQDAKNDAAANRHLANEDNQKSYEDFTSRLRTLAENRSDAVSAKAKALQLKIQNIEAGQKGRLNNAEIQYYAARSGETKAAAKAEMMRAIAYSKGQGSGSSTAATPAGVKPMTTDSLVTYNKTINDTVSNINQAMTKGIKGVNGGKPLDKAKMRAYLVANGGKANAQNWAAFDIATGNGITPTTKKMLEADGVPASYITAHWKQGKSMSGQKPAAAPKSKLSPRSAVAKGNKAFGPLTNGG